MAILAVDSGLNNGIALLNIERQLLLAIAKPRAAIPASGSTIRPGAIGSKERTPPKSAPCAPVPDFG